MCAHQVSFETEGLWGRAPYALQFLISSLDAATTTVRNASFHCAYTNL